MRRLSRITSATIALILLLSCTKHMQVYDPLIYELLESRPASFAEILKNPEKYELQIIYTKIERDANNVPSFSTYRLKAYSDRYFYPASSIKLYAAIIALQKINELNIDGLNKYTTLQIDSAYSGQTTVQFDSSAPGGKPSIAHYIKKLFLVSDNDAFNRLYEFLGQQYLNEKLWEKGLIQTRILHRLSINLDYEQNRYTNPMAFFSQDGLIYKQGLVYNPKPLGLSIPGMQQGKGYIEDGKLIARPKDFSQKNYSPLEELHQFLKMILFPEVFSAAQKFDLKEDDYHFLYKYMSMLPRESMYPSYQDSVTYYDSYVKFFLFGDSKDTLPGHLRIFNKVGNAYGYLIDNAYLVDFERKIEFLLSAVIYVNENQIFNDDQYEYDQIGFPFLAELGKVFYDYELKRERKFRPDLSKFMMNYADQD